MAKRPRLAARRKSLGFSQEALAEQLGVDASTVRRWELGTSNPQPWVRPKVARQLQVSLEQLDQLFRDGKDVTTTDRSAIVESSGRAPGSILLPVIVNGHPVLLPIDAQTVAASKLGPALGQLAPLDGEAAHPVVTAAEWDAMSPLNRRSLLKHGLAASALPALGLEELHQVASAMDDARRYLDTSVTGYLRRQLDLAKADDGTLGPAKTMPIVLGVLGAVEEHAREVKPGVRRELLDLGADAAEFAGWLYRDARDMPKALYWHDRACEWAQEAGNLPMQGYVLLKKSQLAYDEREPVRMLTLAQAVQHGPWQLPDRVQAEAIQQEARAEAMLGASIEQVQRKLDHARQLLASSRGGDGSTLSAHYGPELLSMQTAVCYAEAGQPRYAVDLYDQALTEHAFSPRDYGFFLSWKAGSLALAGEPDQAASVGMESAARAGRAGSNRTRKELARVVKVLTPWKNRPAVRGLAEAVTA